MESLFNKVTGLQTCNFTKKRLQHGRFPSNVANLRTPISKNIYERLLLIVVIYFIENWIKLLRNQIALLFLLKHKITLFYLLSFVFIRFITRCHSLSLIIIFCYSLSFVVTRCHSLSFVVTCCTTRFHSLYHSLSFAVTRCTSRLSFYKRSFLQNDFHVLTDCLYIERAKSKSTWFIQYTNLIKSSDRTSNSKHSTEKRKLKTSWDLSKMN